MHPGGVTIKEDNRGDDAWNGQLVMVAAGILGAIAASSCCILPLAFVILGVSGAWIGNLTALAPYQPYILAVTAAVLGYGFYAVYWRSRRACADKTCEHPLPSQAVRHGLWLGVMLAGVALVFPRIASMLAGI
jgi:mercuric ion transport protein